LTDSFKLLNVSWAKREKCIKDHEIEMQQRILTGKTNKLDVDQRKQLRDKALA